MPDMIVRLYALPSEIEALDAAHSQGIVIRPPVIGEFEALREWVSDFHASWQSELEVALAATPATCFVALEAGVVRGFSVYDATCKNFLGPMGVGESCRGKGIGRALLLCALHAQRAQGYAYAIIGGVGPAAFYEKTVAAQLIHDSTPGIYPDWPAEGSVE